LTALVLALIEGNSWHWGSARVLALFAVAAVGLAAFVRTELRSRAPMVDFGFFRSRSFLGSNLVAFFVTFAMFSQFFFLTLYMQNVLGYTPLETGLRFLPATLLIIVSGPLAGRLADRVGSRPLMTLGLFIVAGALAIQSSLTVHSGYGLLLPGFMLMGLGMGLVMSPMSTAAMNSVDRTKAGLASGTLSMSRMVGGTFGVAVMGALVTAIGRSQLSSSLPHVSASVRSALASALGSGGSATGVHAAPQIIAASHQAFVAALGTGLTIGAAVAAGSDVLAWVLIEPKLTAPTPPPVFEPVAEEQPEPELTAV
jgi:predicted MFS family arabinose efflux permease